MHSQADSERLMEAVAGKMLAGGDGQEQAAEEMKNNIAILNDKTSTGTFNKGASSHTVK